jgi:hypothetical protein
MLTLVSCTNETDNSLSNNDKPKEVTKTTTQLNFIGHWLYQGKRETLVKEFCNEFEFQNQYCAVNLKFPEDVYYSRAKANCEEEFVSQQLLAEKPQYDILRINDQYVSIAAYMKDPDWPKKYLVDFSQYPEFVENTQPELVNDEAKAKWHGIIPGPYLEGYNYAIWYNRELAQKMGIAVKQIGMTFDDFLQYVKAIDSYNKINNSKIIPILENGDWSNFNVLLIPLYLSELDDINEAMKNSVSEKKLKAYFKALYALEELSKYNVYQKDWKKNEFNKTLTTPLNQECFFYINATWMYNYWQNLNEDLANKMVPNELPVFKPSKYYFGGYSIMWAVPKNAPHKDEAVKFLLKLCQPDIAEKWVRYTKCPSGLKGNVTSVSFGKDQFEDFTYNIDKKYGSNKFPYSFFDQAAMLILGERNKNINLHTIDVVTGILSAEEAIADIKRQLR